MGVKPSPCRVPDRAGGPRHRFRAGTGPGPEPVPTRRRSSARHRRSACRVVSGSRWRRARLSTWAVALSRLIRCPTETKTGLTPSWVRSTRPTVSVPSTSGVQEPRRAARRLPAADQRRLADPDRRKPGQHPEMTGQPEPAGMGEPVPVADQQIRFDGQPAQRGEQRRQLAKGEEAGDVGEGGPTGQHHLVDDGEGRGVQDDHRRREPVTVLGVRDVQAGHRRRCRRSRPGQVDRRPQPVLDGLRLGGGTRGGDGRGCHVHPCSMRSNPGRGQRSGRAAQVGATGRGRSAPAPGARCSPPSRCVRPPGRRRCPSPRRTASGRPGTTARRRRRPRPPAVSGVR